MNENFPAEQRESLAIKTGLVPDSEELIKGAHWQVIGPRPFPTGSRIATSTETYAAGAPPSNVNSWVIQEARRQFKQQQLT